MAFSYTRDKVPAKPLDSMKQLRSGVACSPSGSKTVQQPRRNRALSADCTYELTSLTRQPETNLSMLELRENICAQPLRPLDNVISPLNSLTKKVNNPASLPSIHRHKGLADELRKALTSSNIQTAPRS